MSVNWCVCEPSYIYQCAVTVSHYSLLDLFYFIACWGAVILPFLFRKIVSYVFIYCNVRLSAACTTYV